MIDGIELTPEQRQFVYTEISHHNQMLNEMFEQFYTKGSSLSNHEIRAFVDDLITRFKRSLSFEQIQQVEDNFNQEYTLLSEFNPVKDTFEAWFAGVELAPKQEQFVRAEIAHYDEIFEELLDRTYEEDRDLTEDDYRAVDDQLIAGFKENLSPEQIQQVQDNVEKYYARLREEEAHWKPRDNRISLRYGLQESSWRRSKSSMCGLKSLVIIKCLMN